MRLAAPAQVRLCGVPQPRPGMAEGRRGRGFCLIPAQFRHKIEAVMIPAPSLGVGPENGGSRQKMRALCPCADSRPLRRRFSRARRQAAHGPATGPAAADDNVLAHWRPRRRIKRGSPRSGSAPGALPQPSDQKTNAAKLWARNVRMRAKSIEDHIGRPPAYPLIRGVFCARLNPS